MRLNQAHSVERENEILPIASQAIPLADRLYLTEM